MSEIPEHLIDAAQYAVRRSDEADGTYERAIAAAVAAVLAALRPEDAHLVPAWRAERSEVAKNGVRLLAERVEWEGRAAFGELSDPPGSMGPDASPPGEVRQ